MAHSQMGPYHWGGGGGGEAENAERGRMCSNQWGFPNIVTQIKFLSSNPGLGITSPSLSL